MVQAAQEHSGILFSHKKNGMLLFVISCMETENISLSEIRQTER